MFPKFLFFLIEVFSDSIRSKHIYTVVLRLNMIVWMFAAPVYYLYQIKHAYIPQFCDATGGVFMDGFKSANVT